MQTNVGQVLVQQTQAASMAGRAMTAHASPEWLIGTVAPVRSMLCSATNAFSEKICFMFQRLKFTRSRSSMPRHWNLGSVDFSSISCFFLIWASFELNPYHTRAHGPRHATCICTTAATCCHVHAITRGDAWGHMAIVQMHVAPRDGTWRCMGARGSSTNWGNPG